MPSDIRTEEVFRFFPGEQEGLPLSAFARINIKRYSREGAIFHEWLRVFLAPILAQLDQPVEDLVADFEHTRAVLRFSQEFLSFRRVVLTQFRLPKSLVDNFDEHEGLTVEGVGRFYLAYYRAHEARKSPAEEDSHHGAAGPSPAFQRLIENWFVSSGLSMATVREQFVGEAFAGMLRALAPRHVIEQAEGERYWGLFKRGLARYLQVDDQDWANFREFGEWHFRFLFVHNLLDRKSPRATLESLRPIRDPVTLGGALAVGPPHTQNTLSRKRRAVLLAETVITLLYHVLHVSDDRSDAAAELAICVFAGMRHFI
ncbi:uncharacterized protein SCHCODRAFT_02663953 [Schizophyllum commune H4-8]|uniref:Uncharacterized protein n=1 Tax=Schizophyllum commune (strain H4-8 / FGSC 9210) TaxID=578458 RepID=D8PYT2_SCHCM|nr:uncharacterized protein SCHCODRAFT_02663953 [Schizophyllum commune H4-8]KAI5896095.1 hypothetical protein SCHCODRAFT_02663953 [Schizophyllum commune H4-8]